MIALIVELMYLYLAYRYYGEVKSLMGMGDGELLIILVIIGFALFCLLSSNDARKHESRRMGGL